MKMRPSAWLAGLLLRAAAWSEAGPASDAGVVADAEGRLVVGFGRATIAPPWPVEPAYGRQVPTFEFYNHAIEARAVVLQVQDLAVALVECDVIGIGADEADVIKGRMAAAAGIPADRIVLAATHNHS